MITKIISGGQSGADRMGLEAGRAAGLETGGTAPLGFRTENGADLSLKDFGLVEDGSYEYGPRTEKNVLDSDGTVLFGDPFSAGSKLTIRCCRAHKKPVTINPSAFTLRAWIRDNNIQTLNVAGNRGSKLSLARQNEIKGIIIEAVK